MGTHHNQLIVLIKFYFVDFGTMSNVRLLVVEFGSVKMVRWVIEFLVFEIEVSKCPIWLGLSLRGVISFGLRW